MEQFKTDTFNSELNTQVIGALQEELDEVQNEYKDYLAKAEKYTRPLGEAITITVDVDGKKYTVPIPKEGGEASGNGEEAGTEVGKDDMDTEPASAVTFDDDQTELLGDTPTIATDTVNLGGDQAEAEADKAEAEAEKGGEGEEKAPEDLEGGEEDEIKIEDKADTDDEEEAEEGEEKKEGEEEEEKQEEATDSKTETPKKRKVFLKKKKA